MTSSSAHTTASVVVADPTASGSSPPPIVKLLPILVLIIKFSYRAISLLAQASSVIVAPLYLLWPLTLQLLSPITIILSVVLHAAVFTPCTVSYKIIAALYPLYVFCTTACLTGAVVGIFGRYIVVTVLGAFAPSKHTSRRKTIQTQASLPANHPLRRRRRRSVRMQ
ncbi:hypothetical protein BKA83DRAFT_685022 [Pisolithus microcarpus]|nr:hypothetical protein BKA83DRAFT_685022 [Pisolithus microcarpus]